MPGYPITAILKTHAHPELKLVAAVVAMAVFDASEGDDGARRRLAQVAGPWLAWLGDEREVSGSLRADCAPPERSCTLMSSIVLGTVTNDQPHVGE